MEVELHAGAAARAFGGAPYGATKRVKGVPEARQRLVRCQGLGRRV